MMFHYFGFHFVTCPQPLDLPCACGTFKKPVSSIGSVGSLVRFNFHDFPCDFRSFDNLIRFMQVSISSITIPTAHFRRFAPKICPQSEAFASNFLPPGGRRVVGTALEGRAFVKNDVCHF